MSNRKITIKVDESSILDVINELGLINTKKSGWDSNEIYVTLDLPDAKETYEYLAKSKKILDWSIGGIQEFQVGRYTDPDDVSPKEIIEEHPATIKKKEREQEAKIEKPSRDKFAGFVSDLILQSSDPYKAMVNFTEASWRQSRKNPAVMFGTPLFKTNLETEYKAVSGSASIERALLQKVIESYYVGVEMSDAVQDMIDKIREKWKQLSESETLTSVSITLFRNA